VFRCGGPGSLCGPHSPRDVGGIPRDRWEKTTVREATRPLQELHIIAPDAPVLDALKLVTSKDVNQLPVVANGTLQGVVSRSQLVQLLQLRSALQLPTAYHPPLRREKNTTTL
jgi:CBS-domain-containing membrane protein